MTALLPELIVTPTPDNVRVRLLDPCDVPVDLASFFARENANGGFPGENAAIVADVISRQIHYRGWRERSRTLDAAMGLYQPFQCRYVLRILPTTPGYFRVEIVGEVVA